MIDFQVENGVDGIVPCGTTGESPTLSHEEHKTVIRITVEQVKKRVPIVAGTGSNSTREAIELSRHAESAGVDAVLLVNPYYNKPTQEGLFLHFREIANSINIPCVLYNIKGRTGVNLETDTLVRLCDACSNIVAVKEASGDIEQMKEVISRTRDNFSVLSGDDNIAVSLIEKGGDGVISVASNLFPGEMTKMIHLALSDRIKEAYDIDSKLSRFFKALFIETNPIPIKAVMTMSGFCLETYRLPMCPLSKKEYREEIEAALLALKELNLS